MHIVIRSLPAFQEMSCYKEKENETSFGHSVKLHCHYRLVGVRRVLSRFYLLNRVLHAILYIRAFYEMPNFQLIIIPNLGNIYQKYF